MRITKENLTRYDQHFKSWQRRRLGYGKALENWHQTEEAGAVAFYPVGGSSLEGKVKFSFTETPPASGDKSPSNPSTIAGVSSIGIGRCGKNIWPACDFTGSKKDGVTLSVDENGVFTLDGTSEKSYPGYSYWGVRKSILKNCYLPEGTTVSFSMEVIGGTATTSNNQSYAVWAQSECVASDGTAIYKNLNLNSLEIVADVGNRKFSGFFIIAYGGASFSNFKFRVQVEIGSASTAFESCSGADSTLPLGSTYYGGSIDLATGVMTVTYYGMIATGNEAWTNFYTPGTGRVQLSFANSPYKPTANQSGICACTHYPYIGGNTDTRPHWTPYADGEVCLYDSLGSLQAFKTFMAEQYAAGTPLVMAWKIVPYTVQLDPLALSALAQTSRHAPRLNTVYTDADSIQITYQKSPIRAATEQEMAILGLGGNV